MKESVARSYEIEEAKGGLVVRKALYGLLIGGSRWYLYCVPLFIYQGAVKQLCVYVILTHISGFLQTLESHGILNW